MEPALRQQLMDLARAEAELGWSEGGIPIGAVVANESGVVVARRQRQMCIRDRVTTLSPCPMCAGTAVLLGFRRVLIGERRSFAGQESWLLEAGIEVDCLDDPGCMALMERMQQQKPDLWSEDIGH